jgi:hypothetical protein
MKHPTNRKRCRPKEVVAKLKQADEAPAEGVAIAEEAWSLGVSEVTLHRWRAEYSASDRDAVRRLKQQERRERTAQASCGREGAGHPVPNRGGHGGVLSPAHRRRAIDREVVVLHVA